MKSFLYEFLISGLGARAPMNHPWLRPCLKNPRADQLAFDHFYQFHNLKKRRHNNFTAA